jgi:hypothetical protein
MDSSTTSARRRRLHALGLKLNQARKSNHREILSEGRRLTDPMYKKRKKKIESNKRDEEWELSIAARGLDASQSHMLTTANRAEREEERAEIKRKRKGAFGWEAFNDDSILKGHVKRTEAAMKKRKLNGGGGGGGGGVGKVVENDDDDASGVALLGAAPSMAAIDSMVGELDERERLRSKWSRRREVYEDQDVNHINEYNVRRIFFFFFFRC